MKTVKALYKQGCWYIDGVPHVYSMMSYGLDITSGKWYYILIDKGTILEAVEAK